MGWTTGWDGDVVAESRELIAERIVIAAEPSSWSINREAGCANILLS